MDYQLVLGFLDSVFCCSGSSRFPFLEEEAVATVEVDANQTQRRYRWLSRIVKFQLIVAILTIVICIVVGFQISPLIKQKAQLEREVKQKNEELKKLKEELDETNKRLNEAASLENMSADD